MSTMKFSVSSLLVLITPITANVIFKDHGALLDLIERRQTGPCENTATSRDCWGDFSIDTNFYDVAPDTGVVREVMIS